MKQPLYVRSAAEGAAPKPLNVSELGAPPSAPERQVAIDAILAGPPSVLMFRHYWWLTGRPVPMRRNLETNSEYVLLHWRHLVRAARAYVFPSTASTTTIDL